MQSNIKKALVVANGDNDLSFLQQIKGDYELIIAADGAANKLSQANVIPHILVGDFDSVESDILNKYKAMGSKLHQLDPMKDYSDTHIAVDVAIENGYDHVDLAGALGGRWDHSFANLNLLYYGYKKGVQIRLISPDNKAQLLGVGEYLFPIQKDYYWSFLALFEEVVITLEGMKYPLKERLVKQGESIGISNEFESDGKISIKKGSALIMLSRKDNNKSLI